jgi:MFS family permease
MRWMYLAHAISMAGTVAAEVALSILVYQRSGSPLLSALVLVVSFLPWGLGGTVLSALADRFPARPLLVTCDLISGACIAAMLTPRMPVGGLLGLLLLTGLVAPLFQGARAASLAHLLPSDLFPVGRSMLRSISQTMLLTGFAAGSVIVAAVGPTWLLGVDAASFLASATLLRFGTPTTPAAARTDAASAGSVVRESLAGLRDILGRPQLRQLLLLSWVVPAFASAPDGLAVAYTAQAGSKPTSAGLLFTGYSAGMIFAEIVVARTTPVTKRRLLVPLAFVAMLPAIGFVAGPPLLGAAALLFLVGTGSAFNQGLDPLVLAATEPDARGRLFTIQSSGLMTVQGVGIAVAGLIGSVAPARYVIAAIGVAGCIAVAVLAARSVGLRPPTERRMASRSSTASGLPR